MVKGPYASPTHPGVDWIPNGFRDRVSYSDYYASLVPRLTSNDDLVWERVRVFLVGPGNEKNSSNCTDGTTEL